MNQDNYWVEFWKSHGVSTRNDNEHVQVLRTYNKCPIEQGLWDETLRYVATMLQVESNDMLLDLCCGNGLISKYLARTCRRVTAVDISKELLSSLRENDNIEVIESDIRTIKFPKEKFTKILLYAGIQYLNKRETISVIEEAYTWLKPGGILFIGDIPDETKIWNFYNTKERKIIYYNNIKKQKPIIGNWYAKEFLDLIGDLIGFSKFEYVLQPYNQLNALFRFDYKYIK